MDAWRSLKVELHKEAEAIFSSSGEIVLIEANDELDSELTVSRWAAALKLKFVPERLAVRWETDHEYGFETLSQPTGQLARTLMRRLYSGRADDMAGPT